MNVIIGKALRFILNFVLFTVITIAATYYSYATPPELFAIKTGVFPMNVALFLGILLALIFAGINEIITLFIIKLTSKR